MPGSSTGIGENPDRPKPPLGGRRFDHDLDVLAEADGLAGQVTRGGESLLGLAPEQF